MTENLYLDLTLTLACNKYNLDENDWVLQSFTDWKTISVGLEHKISGAKLKASFPREAIRFEEIKNWGEPKKLAYLQALVEEGKELHPELVDSFQHAMLKLNLPTAEPSIEDSILVETEETEEEFVQKVGKKFKRKTV